MTCRRCGGPLDAVGACPEDRWEAKTGKLLEQPMSDRMRAWIITASPYRPVYGAPVGAPSPWNGDAHVEAEMGFLLKRPDMQAFRKWYRRR